MPPRPRSGQPARGAGPTSIATVIASFGRHYLIRTADGDELAAVTRGKRADLAVGDRVRIQALGAGQAVIDGMEPRRNEFKRSDAFRAKLLGANLDRIGVVIAASPPFSEELLFRVLMAAQAEGIEAAIVVNKCDLAQERASIEPRLAVYRALGYRLLECAAKGDAAATRDTLLPWLDGATTLLLGQSGMGKSTLINCLVPDAGLRTQAISEALASGRHTTTFTRLFELPGAQGRIIDSPGFQTFGLEHLSESERAHAMPEMRDRLGQCRFHNCTHQDEPGCALRAAVESGDVDEWRYRLFCRLTDEAQFNARASSRR